MAKALTDYIFKMPDIGEGVVEAEITAWHVAVGDVVEEDAPIADAMTDKATIELTAPVSGTITAVGCEAGDILAVGAALAVFATEDDVDDDEADDTPADSVDSPHAPSGSDTAKALYDFKMPDIGEGVVEAEITAWHVAVGDVVEEDAPVADAMTDKATIELTAPVSGVVKSVGCDAGEILAVGASLALFETDGEGAEPAAPKQSASAPKPATPQPSAPKPAQKKTAAKTGAAPRGKVLASPAVRKRAKDAGLDLTQLTGTGSAGQITQDDLAKFETAIAPLDGEERIKIIGMRRLIAERMQASKRNIPHFTYVEEMDVTELEALRARLNAKKPDDKPKLTVLPFIIRALCMALQKWPQMNALYQDERGYLSQFEGVHLGIATQTDNGLLVPVLRDAQSLSVWDTARGIAALAEGARNGTLSREQLTGATTTLTSLGPLGGIVTTPVINRPEVAIFGPNKIREQLYLDGEVLKQRKVMNFSISCDHRIIDGYDAAVMMQYVKGLLADPLEMFLG